MLHLILSQQTIFQTLLVDWFVIWDKYSFCPIKSSPGFLLPTCIPVFFRVYQNFSVRRQVRTTFCVSAISTISVYMQSCLSLICDKGEENRNMSTSFKLRPKKLFGCPFGQSVGICKCDHVHFYVFDKSGFHTHHLNFKSS